mmetsp:Transcript_1473/g.3007  ORF Transcript_1473/g.3007 Transcript_1473/m.3007 type:complete len:107 (+) Transcript_1473:2-322(+)
MRMQGWRGGVWEQERDRRSLTTALANPLLSGLVERALLLDFGCDIPPSLSGGEDLELQPATGRDLELIAMLRESRGQPPPSAAYLGAHQDLAETDEAGTPLRMGAR